MEVLESDFISTETKLVDWLVSAFSALDMRGFLLQERPHDVAARRKQKSG